jgi:hypothetical protein
LITLDVSKLGRHDLIAYTYGKVLENLKDSETSSE